MSGEVTATSWNTRQFDPAAYGSDGNHACLWDIASEQLAREGYKDAPPAQVQGKINEIVAFHNQQTDRPDFRQINNPDVIGDGQAIFVPPDGMTVPAGTKFKAGDKVPSPDGRTVLSFESVKNDQGQPDTKLFSYRDDGQGYTKTSEVHLGTGVKSIELTNDGTLLAIDDKDQRFVLGAGQSKDARLVVQNDGNAVIYGGDNRVLWASNSQRR